MKLPSFALTSLLVGTALAASQQRRASDLVQRSAAVSSDQYAGAYVDSGNVYNYVTGTFNAPNFTMGANPNNLTWNAWSFSIQVALFGQINYHGDPDWEIVLGGELLAEIDPDGWYMQPYMFGELKDLAIVPGDMIRMTVEAGGRHVNCTIENLTTGLSVYEQVIDDLLQDPGYHQKAKWSVEVDYDDYADYKPVTFTDCSASNATKTVDLDQATVWNYVVDGATIATADIINSHEVVVTHK